MSDKVILTEEGYSKLKKELENLKKVQLPEVIERVKNARELGDLSENADYSQAREQQAFMVGKIQEIEEKIKNAEIVSHGSSSAVVGVGNTVEILCSSQKSTYQIVGENESDPALGKISVNSPIAKAILGRRLRETIKVIVPAGEKECKIVKIK